MAKKKVFQISDALAEGLEETITAAHNYSGELRVDVIPLRRIEVDPDNPRDLAITFEDLYNSISENDPKAERKMKELESLQSIAHSIREQGIINPVVVYKFGDKYRLIAGERRTLASILAGKTEIQAKILETKPSEFKISTLQWIENVERSDLSLWERLRNLEKIISTFAMKRGVAIKQVTVTDISNLIGCTKPHAMNYKAVLVSDENLKKLIQENKIRNLEKAALIAGIQSKEIKQSAIEACLAGAALKKLKVIATQDNIKPAIKNPSKPKESRGRQSTSVNFGVTKNIKVAKAILESVFSNNSFSSLKQHFSNVQWDDYKSITDTFKLVLKKLEELHV